MIFSGEYFDKEGNRYYKEYWPCIFKYIDGDKFYIEVDGQLYYHQNLKKNIRRFMVLNGNKIPNPATKDDITTATIFLIIVMAVTSIFKCNFLLWALELFVYFNYIIDKKYT
jgi:hypothetical protein